jgi:TRAP-type C4-dicarboxylate transport system permease small subunit
LVQPHYAISEMFQNVVAAISRYAAYVSIIVMIAMVVHIMVEIILRSFFATSTHVAEEFVGYGLAAVIYLALGHSLNQGGLIRVDLVLIRLPTRVRRLVEIVIILASFAAMLFVAYFVGRSVLRHYERGTVSWTIAEVPFWIPEGIVFLGIVLFQLQLVAYLLRILAGGAIVDDKKPPL